MALTVVTSTGTSTGSLTQDQHTLSCSGTWVTGDVVVFAAMTWDQGNTLNVPTGTGLSFTQRAVVSAFERDAMYIWTATASSGSTSAVTSTVLAASNSIHNAVMYICPAADGYSLAGSPNVVQQPAGITGTLSGASGNLAIVAAGDWDGGTGTITFVPAGMTTDQTCQQFNANSQYFGHTTLAGASTSVGMSSPAGTGRYAVVAIEVLLGGGPAASRTKAKVYNRAALVRSSTY